MDLPYLFATFIVRSAMMGKGIVTPIFSLMSCTHARCAETLSTERPMSWTFRAFACRRSS